MRMVRQTQRWLARAIQQNSTRAAKGTSLMQTRRHSSTRYTPPTRTHAPAQACDAELLPCLRLQFACKHRCRPRKWAKTSIRYAPLRVHLCHSTRHPLSEAQPNSRVRKCSPAQVCVGRERCRRRLAWVPMLNWLRIRVQDTQEVVQAPQAPPMLAKAPTPIRARTRNRTRKQRTAMRTRVRALQAS